MLSYFFLTWSMILIFHFIYQDLIRNLLKFMLKIYEKIFKKFQNGEIKIF